MKKVIVLLGIILLGYAFNEFSPFEKKLITNFTAQIRELQQEKVYLHTDKSVYTVSTIFYFGHLLIICLLIYIHTVFHTSIAVQMICFSSVP